MLIEIGTIINKYQQQNEVHSGNQVLLKTKEVLNRYPAISNYGLNEAVKNGFIPVVKIGKLNYFERKYKRIFISNISLRNSINYLKKYL